MQNIYLSLIEKLPFLLMVVISLPFHEFSHAFIAYRLGDDTARYSGRLTLNPFAHLDLFGTISMVLFGFGWAKPVPINPVRFRGNMRLGMALTALAGPVSNLLLAFLFITVSKFFALAAAASGMAFLWFLNWLTFMIGQTNIYLAFFNLIPIPPLDGSRILNYFLPYRAQSFVDSLERYSFLILMGILLVDSRTGILSTVLGYVSWAFIWLFDKATFFLGEAGCYPLSYILNYLK